MPWNDVMVAQKKSVIINGYAYPSISQDVLEKWLPDLTYVSTFSYGITPGGGLVQLDDENIIKTALNYGVKPLMVLTALNEEGVFSSELVSDLLNNSSAQDALIENILENLRAKNMAGVDFDFEYVFPENRDKYVQLVDKARQRLNNEGYIVTVALAPKTSTDQKGLLYEGHDYAGMGKAANYALLMTYEWGYTYGPPMAVSPINKVREVLDYGVTQIPPNKILMGIPNYGYDWTLPYVKGESRARKISNTEAVEIAKRAGVEIQYDEVAQTPHFTYYDENGTQHEVWFEDERSMREKLKLIQEYDLAGASIWEIMNYFPPTSALLNSMYDVKKV